MRLIPGFRAQEKTGDTSSRHAATPSPARVHHRHRRRTIMRQMLIAAAIAAGLVAIWAALLPIAA
jgi:hypothetical protein